MVEKTVQLAPGAAPLQQDAPLAAEVQGGTNMGAKGAKIQILEAVPRAGHFVRPVGSDIAKGATG